MPHDVRVEAAFLVARRHQQGLGQPGRQHQGHLVAPVPDHHLPGGRPQLSRVPHPQRALPPVPPPELRRRAEQARRNEADQLEQVVEPVLHRGGGEQQQVAGAEQAREAPRRATRTAQPVCLVRDDHIPGPLAELVAKRIPAGRSKRRQDDRTLGAVGAVLVPAGAGHYGREGELAVKLFPPLLHQPGWGQDERPIGQPTQAQLAEDQPGLDGLTQPHLVGQDRAAVHLAQDGSGRVELMIERREAQSRERDQRLEARPAPHRDRLLHQEADLGVEHGPAPEAVEKCLVAVKLRVGRTGPAPCTLGSGTYLEL